MRFFSHKFPKKRMDTAVWHLGGPKSDAHRGREHGTARSYLGMIRPLRKKPLRNLA
jgi:hypothetical protein